MSAHSLRVAFVSELYIFSFYIIFFTLGPFIYPSDLTWLCHLHFIFGFVFGLLSAFQMLLPLHIFVLV